MKHTNGWLLPLALLALNAIPLGASGLRLAQLFGGEPLDADSARFFASPVSTVLHLVSSSLFIVAGAFQFSAPLRRRWPGWHRHAGRVLTVSGLVSGLSGIWMTLYFPHVDGDGPLLYVFRLVFGAAMVVCMVQGFVTARRRDFGAHRAWMTRGYAIGIGAGTQVVVHIPWLLLGGRPEELERALLLGAGWAINLAVAEWIIRSRGTPGPIASRAVPRGGLPQE